VANDHNLSQVTHLPLLVLSTSGGEVRWLIYYIASRAVALYLDYLTSPSPFPSASPLSYRWLHLLFLTLPARFALLDRISLALPSHTTLGEYDAEPGIVPAF
jgi:hypothetical protein